MAGSSRLEEVALHLKKRAPGDPHAERFVRRFYAGVALDEVTGLSSEDLTLAALSLWRLGARREHGTILLRVHNPTRERDGWQSPNTVIEIVNDDMPFLVDSVTHELGRLEVPVRLTIHSSLDPIGPATSSLPTEREGR